MRAYLYCILYLYIYIRDLRACIYRFACSSLKIAHFMTGYSHYRVYMRMLNIGKNQERQMTRVQGCCLQCRDISNTMPISKQQRQ